MPYGFLKNQIERLQKQLIAILDEDALTYVIHSNPGFNTSFFPLYTIIKNLDFKTDFGIKALKTFDILKETYDRFNLKWKHKKAFMSILEDLIILVQKQP